MRCLVRIFFTGVMLCAMSVLAEVTYKPYIQPGNNDGRGATDRMLVAWQTDESEPHEAAYTVEFGRRSLRRTAIVVGRTVNSYLLADPRLPLPVGWRGPRVNYYALLTGLDFDATYFYRVSGPGLPRHGFESSFRTGTHTGDFSFQVQGDEGAFIPDPFNPPYLANFESRIVHVMLNISDYSRRMGLDLEQPRFAINTGDNVYNLGTDSNYRDFWMPVWNSDLDSNDIGGPFIRSIPYYIVAGNHDLGGGPGVSANLLADSDSPAFSLDSGGGDALAYFNNYYFPLNGPTGVDPQYVWNGDVSTSDGFLFRYQGTTYTSPEAIEAFRASTTTNTGGTAEGNGQRRQIDTMGNYSFDYGNAHFVFVDANPRLFDSRAGACCTYDHPPFNFPEYPSIIKDWLIRDLDGSDQLWKFVVYHQPAFNSGDLTLRNNQMRRIAKLLEDHGVNMVFQGHQHHYQRLFPIRSLPGVADVPTTDRDPVVQIDTAFDGSERTVPDGVIYLVEGAGGDWEFDNSFGPPRGARVSLDQEDSACGTFTYDPPGFTFPQGPDSWLDTHLTTVQMTPFMDGAGSGPKITSKLKGKLFSFGQVVVHDNSLTLYQISEPLSDESSATKENPYPYGTDLFGNTNNDPLSNTLVDPATGLIVSGTTDGVPALLDRFTVTKPDLRSQVSATLSVRRPPRRSDTYVFEVVLRNGASLPLNGVQIVLTLPKEIDFVRTSLGSATVLGQDAIVTIGRLAAGEGTTIEIDGYAHVALAKDHAARLVMRSSTALPITAPLVP